MTRDMQLYYEAHNEIFPLEEQLRKSFNPLRDYDEELIPGPVLDIGCGQSLNLIELATSDRQLVGVDEDAYQLEELRKSFRVYKGDDNNLITVQASLLKDEMPLGEFSVIILSNILHFFDLDDCRKIVDIIEERTAKGSLVYLTVHSKNYYVNDPSNPNSHSYFKHYFSQVELDNLFEVGKFARVYAAQIDKKPSAKEMLVRERWLDKILDCRNITDQSLRIRYHQASPARGDDADIVCIYKRE